LLLAGTALYLLTVSAQDVILLWRLHVVWQRWWLVALGGLIELGVIGCTTSALIVLANPHTTYSTATIYRLVVPFYALHLFFNLSVTLLITYKLWSMGRKLESFFPGHGGYYARAMGIVVESGSLYTLATAVNFGMFVARFQVAYILPNVLTQLATLTPLLIIVRVGCCFSPDSSGSGYAVTDIQSPIEAARESPVTQMIRGRQTKLQLRAQDQARQREMRMAVRREVRLETPVEGASVVDRERDSFDLEMEELGRKGRKSRDGQV